MRVLKLIGVVVLIATIPIYSLCFVVQGDEVDFSWEKQEAFIKNAYVEYQGLFFHSSYLSLANGKISMENTEFTTCDLPHPHYRLDVKYIQFPLTGKKRKIYAKNAALYFGKRKILSLPPFRISLNIEERKKEDALSLPRLEFSKDFGLSIVSEFSFSTGYDNGKTKIGYSTLKGVFGKISFPISSHAIFDIGKHEVITGKKISPLYINEEPHILLQENDFSVSVGKFAEEPTGQRARRLRFSFSPTLLQKRIKENLSLGVIGKGAYSLYDKEKEYSSIGGEISLRAEVKSSQTNLSLGYLALGGSTPFYFDREELTSYARLDLMKEGNKWRWETSGIWDLKNGKFYDATLTLYRKLHCLEPGISWQNRGRLIQLKLKLAGF